MTTGERRAVSSRTIRLEIEVEPTNPISGRLASPTPQTDTFVGWTELVAALHRALVAGGLTTEGKEQP